MPSSKDKASSPGLGPREAASPTRPGARARDASSSPAPSVRAVSSTTPASPNEAASARTASPRNSPSNRAVAGAPRPESSAAAPRPKALAADSPRAKSSAAASPQAKSSAAASPQATPSAAASPRAKSAAASHSRARSQSPGAPSARSRSPAGSQDGGTQQALVATPKRPAKAKKAALSKKKARSSGESAKVNLDGDGVASRDEEDARARLLSLEAEAKKLRSMLDNASTATPRQASLPGRKKPKAKAVKRSRSFAEGEAECPPSGDESQLREWLMGHVEDPEKLLAAQRREIQRFQEWLRPEPKPIPPTQLSVRPASAKESRRSVLRAPVQSRYSQASLAQARSRASSIKSERSGQSSPEQPARRSVRSAAANQSRPAESRYSQQGRSRASSVKSERSDHSPDKNSPAQPRVSQTPAVQGHRALSVTSVRSGLSQERSSPVRLQAESGQLKMSARQGKAQLTKSDELLSQRRQKSPERQMKPEGSLLASPASKGLLSEFRAKAKQRASQSPMSARALSRQLSSPMRLSGHASTRSQSSTPSVQKQQRSQSPEKRALRPGQQQAPHSQGVNPRGSLLRAGGSRSPSPCPEADAQPQSAFREVDSTPESPARWMRWSKPHERESESYELVAECGVTKLGMIPDILSDGRVVATHVEDWSWVWRKGLMHGDELVEVDDKLASEMSEVQLRWALMSRPLRLAFRKRRQFAPGDSGGWQPKVQDGLAEESEEASAVKQKRWNGFRQRQADRDDTILDARPAERSQPAEPSKSRGRLSSSRSLWSKRGTQQGEAAELDESRAEVMQRYSKAAARDDQSKTGAEAERPLEPESPKAKVSTDRDARSKEHMEQAQLLDQRRSISSVQAGSDIQGDVGTELAQTVELRATGPAGRYTRSSQPNLSEKSSEQVDPQDAGSGTPATRAPKSAIEPGHNSQVEEDAEKGQPDETMRLNSSRSVTGRSYDDRPEEARPAEAKGPEGKMSARHDALDKDDVQQGQLANKSKAGAKAKQGQLDEPKEARSRVAAAKSAQSDKVVGQGYPSEPKEAKGKVSTMRDSQSKEVQGVESKGLRRRVSAKREGQGKQSVAHGGPAAPGESRSLAKKKVQIKKGSDADQPDEGTESTKKSLKGLKKVAVKPKAKQKDPAQKDPVQKGQAWRKQLVIVDPRAEIRFQESPLTAPCRGSFRIINTSVSSCVAFRIKTTAPRNYHLVLPQAWTLRPEESKDVNFVFKPRGLVEAVAPDYCFKVQATLLKEYREVDNDEFLNEFELVGLVEEHRLHVIFEDAAKYAPSSFSASRPTLPGSPSAFSSLHSQHAKRQQQMAALREAERQRKIAEFESLVTPAVQGSPTEIGAICQRLSDEGRLKEERLKKSAQDLQDREQAALATPFNSSKKDISFGHDAPWEAWFKEEAQHLQLMEKERKQKYDAETKYLEDNSVHRDVAHGSDAAGRLYQDALNRQQKYFKMQREEVAKDLANCMRTCGKPGTADLEAVILRHLQDAERRRENLVKLEKKAHEEALENAGGGTSSPERRAGALKHASTLHQQWDKHQQDLVALQEAYQDAQDEFVRQASVHPEAPEHWGPEAVDEMVKRLHPEPKPKAKPKANRRSTQRRSSAVSSSNTPFDQPSTPLTADNLTAMTEAQDAEVLAVDDAEADGEQPEDLQAESMAWESQDEGEDAADDERGGDEEDCLDASPMRSDEGVLGRAQTEGTGRGSAPAPTAALGRALTDGAAVRQPRGRSSASGSEGTKN